MFSALKRLTSRSETNGVSTITPPGLTTMSSALQKKFSKGVQYNMKIILKGDRNSGKTCLFRRLQGLPFVEEYTPTDEIQAANIQWNYKTTDDVVKVEVWDVVDKAKKKKSLPNKLKIENNHSKGQGDEGAEDVQEIGLDATFLDVYKNTNGVILVFDITKNWTYDYVKREVSSIPSHIPILILGNHRDMGHHRATAADTVYYFVESLIREEGSAEIRYAESSMRNGFGLKYIHKFFNLPFLQLQRETLLKQLETNREENNVTLQELDYHAESDDANYDLFIEGLSQKRRQVADALAPSKISLAEAQALAQERALKEGNVAAAVAVASKPSIVVESATGSKSALPPNAITNVPNQTITSIGKTLQESASLSISKKSSDPNFNGVQPTPEHQQQSSNLVLAKNSASTRSSNSSLGSGSVGSKNSSSANNKAINSSAAATQNATDNVSVVSNIVDDFIPDDDYQVHVEKSFYDDGATKGHQGHQNKNKNVKQHEFETSDEENEDDDTENGNPLVTAFEEDIVPEKFNSPLVSGRPSAVVKSTGAGASGNNNFSVTEDSEKKVKSSESSPSKFCILSSSDEEPELDENPSEIQDPSKHAPLNLDIDVSFFMKEFDEAQEKNEAVPPISEVSGSTSHKSKKKDKEKDRDSKRKSKKSTTSEAISKSSHHKKSSKHKKSGSSSNSKKDHHPLDLEDFLSGGGPEANSGGSGVDTNAYEAL